MQAQKKGMRKMAITEKKAEPEVRDELKILEDMWKVEAKNSPVNLIMHLAERVASWEKYWNLLRSRTLLMKYHKKWRSYAAATRLKYFLIENSVKFETEKSIVLKGSENQRGIENDNPRLAEALKKFNLAQDTSIPSFGSLLAALNTNPEFGISYMQTHGIELIGWVNSLKENDRLKDKLRKLVIEISGAEIAEIDNCIADLRSWKDFRIGNNIMFFWNRAMVYLNGGKLEEKAFLGFKFFVDENLKKAVLQSSAVRGLLTYQAQIKFFEKWIPIIKDAMPRDEWEGFSKKDEQGNEFYSNLMSGERFIELFRGKFGNSKFAERMEALHSNETPSAWYAELNLLYKRLIHPSYQNAYIILPASEDFVKILSQRRQELSAGDINAKLRGLIAILKELFNEAVRKSRNVKAYEELLAHELELLKKETRAEKSAFMNVLLDHGEAVITLVERSASWTDKIHRVIESLDKGYAYLTRQKLQILRRRTRRQVSPFSFADEQIRKEDDLAKEIRLLAARQAEARVEEIMEMQAEINENVKHAASVDEIMRMAMPNYISSRGEAPKEKI